MGLHTAGCVRDRCVGRQRINGRRIGRRCSRLCRPGRCHPDRSHRRLRHQRLRQRRQQVQPRLYRCRRLQRAGQGQVQCRRRRYGRAAQLQCLGSRAGACQTGAGVVVATGRRLGAGLAQAGQRHRGVGQPALPALLLVGLLTQPAVDTLAQRVEVGLLRRLDPGGVQRPPVAVQRHQVVERHIGLPDQRGGAVGQRQHPGLGGAAGHRSLQPLLGQPVQPPVVAAKRTLGLAQRGLARHRLHCGQFDVQPGRALRHGQQRGVIADGRLQPRLPGGTLGVVLAGAGLGLGQRCLLGLGLRRRRCDGGNNRRGRRLPFLEKPAQHREGRSSEGCAVQRGRHRSAGLPAATRQFRPGRGVVHRPSAGLFALSAATPALPAGRMCANPGAHMRRGTLRVPHSRSHAP